MNFQVKPISAPIADQVRATLKSPQYGHAAQVSRAAGYGPCRSCLQKFRENLENRILFTYNAFAGLADLPLPSPIFIHEDSCPAYDQNEFPIELRNLPMVFESYDADGEMRRRVKIADRTIENSIAELFADGAANYIHIRNAEAGCFIARIERCEEN